MGLSMLTRQSLAVGLASEEAAAEIARVLNTLTTTGKVFYVHYGTGKNGAGAGVFPEAPFKTIDYAIASCTANKGDVILVMPGHSESLATDIDVDGSSRLYIADWRAGGFSYLGKGKQQGMIQQVVANGVTK